MRQLLVPFTDFLRPDSRLGKDAANVGSPFRTFVMDARRLVKQANDPTLEFAQAIHGRTTGRGTSIIDTVHLFEVARASATLEKSQSLVSAVRNGVKDWFASYLPWMTTSANGIEEREAKNNHGSCWFLQVAEFARCTGNSELLSCCRDRFASVLVPNQIAPTVASPWSWPAPSLMVIACSIWTRWVCCARSLLLFRIPYGSLKLPMTAESEKAVEYIFPSIADNRRWLLPAEVQYFAEWPVRQPSLLFAGLAFSRPEHRKLWRPLNSQPVTDEIIRNFPIRQPVL